VIDDMNHMPDEMIEEVRRLPAEQRFSFLWDRTTRENRAYVEPFIRDVVEGGADARSWRRGRVLVPKSSFYELLVSSVDQILQPLGDPGEAGWFTIWSDPRMDFSARYNGSPAVLLPDVHYRWWRPDGTVDLVLSRHFELRPTPRIRPAVRRWIARRIANRDTLHEHPAILDIGAFAREFEVEVDDLSEDVVRAMRALAAEARLSDRSNDPGFRGPDSLYE
jgi:hypothetical protein